MPIRNQNTNAEHQNIPFNSSTTKSGIPLLNDKLKFQIYQFLNFIHSTNFSKNIFSILLSAKHARKAKTLIHI